MLLDDLARDLAILMGSRMNLEAFKLKDQPGFKIRLVKFKKIQIFI